MRPPSLPYTISLCTLLIIFFFPLFEYELEWNYVDWDSTISRRTGSNIIEITRQFDSPRVPGIEPGWKDAHEKVEKLLATVSKNMLDEYQFTWNYTVVSDAVAVDRTIHINNDVGGYIAMLHPKSLQLNSTYRSICFISNMDSVYNSLGFTSNALGVVQSILALEELAAKPGIKIPITVVITDTQVSGSNVLLSLYSLPELQKCSHNVLLDSLGLAQTVPDVIHLSDLNWKASKSLKKSYSYLRISNFILDAASTLSLLSSSEISLMKRNPIHPSFSKLSYSDAQFLHFSPNDDSSHAKAAAVKARYDRLIDIATSLGQLDNSVLDKPSNWIRSSYISTMGRTHNISFTEEVIFIIIGMTCSILFLNVGHMGHTSAISNGKKKAGIIFISQLFIVCITIVIFLVWFAIDPFISHKINYYILTIIIIVALVALISFVLQLVYFSNYFSRDYAGSIMSYSSIIYGIIAAILLLCGLHCSLQFSIPCFLFGTTNIFLFIRKLPFLTHLKWRKFCYAVSLSFCAFTSFAINIGTACATLHVTYGMISHQDVTVNILIVTSFWTGVFPLLLTLSCLKIIYFPRDHTAQTPTVHLQLLVLESEVEDEEEKVSYRKYQKSLFISFMIVLGILLYQSSNLPPWNDDQPVPVRAGITYLSNEYHNLPSNTTKFGNFMISGNRVMLETMEDVISKLSLEDGYKVENITHSNCYLSQHTLGKCLKLDFSQYGKSVQFPLFEDSFNASYVVPISRLYNEPINYTEYTKDFMLHIAPRNSTSMYGYPIVLVRIYTSKVDNRDSKIYNNEITSSIEYNNKTLSAKGFVVNCIIHSNGDRERRIPLHIKSRVGSQVVIRLTDVSRYAPPIMDIMKRGLGTSFYYAGLTDLAFLSHSTNYFVQYE